MVRVAAPISGAKTDAGARMATIRVGIVTVSNTEQLKRVIESQLGGTAAYRQSMRVLPGPKAPPHWDGVVHVFDLKNNPKSRRAFAWSSAIKGGHKPRYFAVLASSRISGPADAVRAAIAAVKKLGKK